MIPDFFQPCLTDEQKGRVCGVLSVGCDRQTAADFIGCSITDIGRAMQQDSEFAAHIRRTEAGCEVEHMRTIQQAAKDVKNWRASVWWLERHSPERFGSRGAGAATPRLLKLFAKRMIDVLSAEFSTDEAKYRVIARFDVEIATLEEIIRFAAAGDLSRPADSLLIDSQEPSHPDSANDLDDQEVT
jgi:hypothetical protein